MARRVRIEVAPDDDGLRLDQLLAKHVPELSRRKARVLIDIGGVFVGGSRVKVASRRIRPGQLVEAVLGGALDRASGEVGRAARAADEAALPDYELVYQDDDLLVVDKPFGLLSAPTPESDRGNLLALLEQRIGGRVYLIHRLDLETSGLLVYALSGRANRALAERFRVHDIDREYIAVLAGTPEVAGGDRFEVAEPVQGKRARTHFEIVERLADATVVRARLETGRTHQIRRHARFVGAPVLGDPRYGDPRASALRPPRMALHAARLGFIHPTSGERVAWDSPLPEVLEQWLTELRQR